MTTFTTEDSLQAEQQEKMGVPYVDGEMVPFIGWVQYEPAVIVNCGASIPKENDRT